MKDITTKTLINFLPFDPKVKLDLLEKYNNLPKEEEIRISGLIWDAYYSFFDIKVQENLDELIEEAKKNGTAPNDTFYGKALEKTQTEIYGEMGKSEDSLDLSAARKSMEQIVNEINASKKTIN